MAQDNAWHCLHTSHPVPCVNGSCLLFKTISNADVGVTAKLTFEFWFSINFSLLPIVNEQIFVVPRCGDRRLIHGSIWSSMASLIWIVRRRVGSRNRIWNSVLEFNSKFDLKIGKIVSWYSFSGFLKKSERTWKWIPSLFIYLFIKLNSRNLLDLWRKRLRTKLENMENGRQFF